MQGALCSVNKTLAICGGLNKNVCHRLICLKFSHIESSTIRKCGHVEAGVDLLEEVHRCVGGHSYLIYSQAMPNMVHNLLMLLKDQDVEISALCPALCLPAHWHGSTLMIID